jgi:hypothetical protein
MRAAAATLATVAALVIAAPAAAAPTLAKVGDFDDPVYVTAPPGDSGRLMVVEKPGRIQLLVNGVKQAQPFVDLTGVTRSTEFERGLLSMAFAPDYATSGRFFVYLTANQPLGQLQVLELRRSSGTLDSADPGPVRTVLAIDHPGEDNHNGGQLQIGPDGMLWIGTGDGGGANDVHRNAQDPGSLLGKLLRMDPNGTGGPAIWSNGLRNPWRFSFDRRTGDLVLADVGQNDWEEIDFAPAPGWNQGGNYGWPCWEGTQRNSNSCNPPVHTDPVHERQQTSGGVCSITGGYVVRDPGLPTLLGRYVYGDFCDPQVRSLVLTDAASTDAPAGFSVPSTSSFGEDACGRVYVASLNGPVYRIEDGASGCSLPAPPAPPGAPPATTSHRGIPPRLGVAVSGRRTALTRRRLRVAVRSDVAADVSAGGRVRRAGALRGAAGHVAAGGRRILNVRLRPAVARRARGVLARRGRAVVRITVRGRDAEGDVATVRRSVTLRRRR